MSIFTDCDIPLGPNDKVLSIAVSNVYINPTVAVTTQNKILLFNESGEKHDYELSRNISPTSLCWHPSNPLVAIGWENGTITLWNEENKMAKEEAQGHKDKVTLIVFNPSGSRMVSCDASGKVNVWKGLNVMASYTKKGEITHCIFCELNMDQKLKTSNLFFFGGTNGIVCLADDQNHCSDVCKVGGAIKSLLFYEKENSVIIITSTLLLVQFRISTSEKSGPDKKVKLSIAGDPEKLQSIWIGHCLLLTCSFENLLRFWHLEEDENYALTMFDLKGEDIQQQFAGDKFSCVGLERKGRVLIAGTQKGNLLFWKNQTVGNDSPQEQESWKALPFIPFEAPISRLSIGNNNGVIALQFGNQVALVTETIIRGKMSNSVKLLQTSADKVQVHVSNEIIKQMYLFESNDNIKGLDCNDQNLLVWTNKAIEVHEIVCTPKEVQVNKVSSFTQKCIRNCLFGDNIILCGEYEISVSNFKGVVKSNLKFAESEGKTSDIRVMNSYMVMWTNKNYIRIFDISRREPKQLGVTRKFEDSTGPLGYIRSCSLNSNASKVIIIADQLKNGVISADQKFYIYDADMDTFMKFDCGEGILPLESFYDSKDKRFFGVLVNTQQAKREKQEKEIDHTQVQKFEGGAGEKSKISKEEMSHLQLITFFATSENGIKKQDTYEIESYIEGVFGLRIPELIYIIRQESTDIANSFTLQTRKMKDFEDLTQIDEPIREAIMNFSFYLSTGNLDEAYKSVKSVNNPAVWEKMAAMSVKSRRLDVAEICLGNMRFARGARAVREAKQHPELESQLAMVAIQLNMKDEAVKLYEQVQRHDLLNQLYQCDGNWEEAIAIAEKHDRINLKNTYYNAAQQYEVSKDYARAIEFYEKSNTYKKEVPRMLFKAGEIGMLQQYIQNKSDPELSKWYAQYLESKGDEQQAVKFYKLAEDWSSVTRILCNQNNFNEVKQLCLQTGDPASNYYLAKQLEIRNIIPEAIQYYAKAQYFTQAVKLARERGMDSDVMTLSLQAPQPVKLQSAAYFEDKGFIDKALDLYMKGGNYRKALEVAQANNMRELIPQILSVLDSQKAVSQTEVSTDPDKNVQNFINSGQPERAIPLLLQQKQYERALNVCIQNKIPLTDDLVKKIIPDDSNLDEGKKKNMTEQIAEHCKSLGNFASASNYYIKLGDKVKAIQCLFNLGSIEKVITFAQNARDSQIFIMAGNFLQTADWRKNGNLMKHIVVFYTKAKAFDHLARFFDACSMLEIDEYRDYEKAVAALKEAEKYAKQATEPDAQQHLQAIQRKIKVIESFINARNATEQDPNYMLTVCNQLVDTPHIEQAMRAGDIFAHMIEYYCQAGQYEQAYEQIEKMRMKKIIIAPYLDSALVKEIEQRVGKSQANQGYQQSQRQNFGYQQQQQFQNGDDDEQFQEEEVVEEEDLN